MDSLRELGSCLDAQIRQLRTMPSSGRPSRYRVHLQRVCIKKRRQQGTAGKSAAFLVLLRIHYANLPVSAMETGPLIVDLREAADTCPLVD
jgi:hypothetical protein